MNVGTLSGMITDAAGQLRAFIEHGQIPLIPTKRLVLKLTARISDPERQGNLNEDLNAAVDRLWSEPWHRSKARDLLDQVLAAGRN